MKERPIIFNTEMVKAILEGRKTQTRRPIKPQPEYLEYGSIYSNKAEYRWSFKDHDFSNIESIIPFAPLGKLGDFLWVRETFSDQSSPIGKDKFIVYKATEVEPDLFEGMWTPSIHMPRWASRITLEITDVRVEHVQDIDETDADCEGVEKLECDTYTESFKKLWDSIYNNWDDNPWVWVYEFKIKELKCKQTN